MRRLALLVTSATSNLGFLVWIYCFGVFLSSGWLVLHSCLSEDLLHPIIISKRQRQTETKLGARVC